MLRPFSVEVPDDQSKVLIWVASDMVRHAYFLIFFLSRSTALLDAFRVRVPSTIRRESSIYVSQQRFLHSLPAERRRRVHVLDDSFSNFGKDVSNPRASDEAAMSQAVVSNSNEGDRNNRGKIYQACQYIIAVVMKTTLWQDYSSSLTMKPVVTKSFSSMIGFSLGDIIAQLIFSKVNFKRVD